MTDRLDWQTCCRGRRSCPVVAVQGDEIYIKDDDESIVCVSYEQLCDIFSHVQELQEG